MKLDVVNTKLAVTPAVRVLEWKLQMLTRLDKERISLFRRVTMRAVEKMHKR